MRHAGEFLECTIVDRFLGPELSVVRPGLLDVGHQVLQRVCEKDVSKCHIFGLSFLMMESDPPHVV